MYTACLFCNLSLGRNEALEAFPVGRRLAYDQAMGRLWVVCRRCERWNLTPLEERWEAIEQAERLYRGTRLRVSTENVGLARMADGTELVRIGRPLRPEFAAWRYGDQFGRRRRRHLVRTGAVLAFGVGAVTGAATVGLGLYMTGYLGWGLYQRFVNGNPNVTVARLRGPDGTLLHVDRAHLLSTTIIADAHGAPAVSVTHLRGRALLSGDDALRAIGQLMPAANRLGGTREDVTVAVRCIEDAGSAERYVASLPTSGALAPRPSSRAARLTAALVNPYVDGLFALPLPVRLAIEMATHEEQERRALEGELAELERAWRDAEAIAEIADSLALPARVEDAHARLRARSRPGG